MSDIVHYFPITAPAERVFRGVSMPSELDSWWTKKCSGEPVEGKEYGLWFGPEYDWSAVVSRCVTSKEFELNFQKADGDWQGTRIGFELETNNDVTQVRFYHSGWKEANDHFQTSSYCWAMYLRLLKRYIENSEVVPYELRLDV